MLRLPLKLRAERILTARHLRDALDATIRSIGGVTLLRTAMELRGVPCHEERDYDADPDSISCSRSFGLARSNREPRLRGGYAQGLGARSWHMKRQKLSARPTTRWDELLTVK